MNFVNGLLLLSAAHGFVTAGLLAYGRVTPGLWAGHSARGLALTSVGFALFAGAGMYAGDGALGMGASLVASALVLGGSVLSRRAARAAGQLPVGRPEARWVKHA